jgi:2'-5' RNA ligase
MRTFIALALPPKIKTEISKLQNLLQQPDYKSSLKWVDPNNLHITLKFLGETTPEKVDLLSEKIKKHLHPVKPITVTLSNLGAFPSISKPNVIWSDVFPKDELIMTFKNIETICLSEGFEQEQKPFKTHITLARLKRGTTQEQIKQISSVLKNNITIPPLTFNIDGVTIYKSVLTPQGPLYTALGFID